MKIPNIALGTLAALATADISPKAIATSESETSTAYKTASLPSLEAQAQRSFIDIQGHPARDFIEELQRRNIIQGFPDGTFEPEAPMTRAQLAALLVKAFPKQSPIDTQQVNSYPAPAPASAHWANAALLAASEMGFFQGDQNSQTNPNRTVSRLQVLKALVKGLELKALEEMPLDSSVYFEDIAAITDEEKEIVAAAIANQLIILDPNNRFLHPSRTATRADVAGFLYRALLLQDKQPVLAEASASSSYAAYQDEELQGENVSQLSQITDLDYSAAANYWDESNDWLDRADSSENIEDLELFDRSDSFSNNPSDSSSNKNEMAAPSPLIEDRRFERTDLLGAEIRDRLRERLSSSLKQNSSEQHSSEQHSSRQQAIAEPRESQEDIVAVRVRDRLRERLSRQQNSSQESFLEPNSYEQNSYEQDYSRGQAMAEPRKFQGDMIAVRVLDRLERLSSQQNSSEPNSSEQSFFQQDYSQPNSSEQSFSQQDYSRGQAIAEPRESQEDIVAVRVRDRLERLRHKLPNFSSSSSDSPISPKLPPLRSATAYLPKPPLMFEGYIWPAKGVFTSGYGIRWGRMHYGIDVAGPIGTPILAAAQGTVTYADWNGGYGYLVEIEHSDGSLTRYAHNHRILVLVGQQVESGEQIAEMGSTGYSTGPHLHFEIHVPGRGPVDPVAYLQEPPPRVAVKELKPLD